VGAIFFGLQASAFGDCRVEANENVCAGRTTVEQAMPAVTFNRVAIASTIAGAAVLAGGVTWLVLASRSSRETPVVVAPTADASSVGLVVRCAL
jgi:anti-sigma-K factor RskA